MEVLYRLCTVFHSLLLLLSENLPKLHEGCCKFCSICIFIKLPPLYNKEYCFQYFFWHKQLTALSDFFPVSFYNIFVSKAWKQKRDDENGHKHSSTEEAKPTSDSFNIFYFDHEL